MSGFHRIQREIKMFVLCILIFIFHAECPPMQNYFCIRYPLSRRLRYLPVRSERNPRWDRMIFYLLIIVLFSAHCTVATSHQLQSLMGNNIWRSLLSVTPSINHTNYLSPCNIYDNATKDTALIASIPHLFWCFDTHIRKKPNPPTAVDSVMFLPCVWLMLHLWWHYCCCLSLILHSIPVQLLIQGLDPTFFSFFFIKVNYNTFMHTWGSDDSCVGENSNPQKK